VEEKVNERKRVAKEMRLSERLLEIFDEIKYYPARRARGDISVSPLASCAEEAHLPSGEKAVAFDLRGIRYTMSFTDRLASSFFPRDNNPDSYGALTLYQAETPVFAASYAGYTGLAGTTYQSVDVSAFIPGEWIAAFIELQEDLAAIREEARLRDKYDRSKLEKLKKNFGL
jgi:hypothetical protein